jgi:hypothetical protein
MTVCTFLQAWIWSARRWFCITCMQCLQTILARDSMVIEDHRIRAWVAGLAWVPLG